MVVAVHIWYMYLCPYIVEYGALPIGTSVLHNQHTS